MCNIMSRFVHAPIFFCVCNTYRLLKGHWEICYVFFYDPTTQDIAGHLDALEEFFISLKKSYEKVNYNFPISLNRWYIFNIDCLSLTGSSVFTPNTEYSVINDRSHYYEDKKHDVNSPLFFAPNFLSLEIIKMSLVNSVLLGDRSPKSVH